MKAIKFIMLLMALIGITLIILVGEVSAAEWDNIKSYNPNDRSITISNSFLGMFGLDKIAKITPNTPHVYSVIRGKDRLVAEFTIESYLEYKEKVYDGMKFYNLKTGKEIQRDYTIRYKDVEAYDYPNYVEDCKDTGEINKTDGSKIWDCTYTYAPITRLRKVWKDLDVNADLPKGTLEIGVFSDVLPGDYVEFIPKWFNLNLVEYSVWTDSLNVDLEVYYDFNSTDNLVDPTFNNLTYRQGTAVYNDSDCLIGKCGHVSSNNNFKILSNNIMDFKGNFTLNYWLKAYDLGESANPFWMGFADTFGNIGWNSPYTVYFQDSWTGTQVNGKATGLDQWFMITITRDEDAGGNVSVYVNGTIQGSGTKSVMNKTQDWYLGSHANPALNFDLNGAFDELGYWSRTLTATEVSDLFNSGAGIGYVPTGPGIPEVTINKPDFANYTTTPQTLDFNCTATDETEVKNITLYLNGVLNYTQLGSGGTDLELFVTQTLGEGNYNIQCKVRDDENNEGTSNTNIVIIDATPPVVNIDFPLNGSTAAVFNKYGMVYFNVSVSDNVGLRNCWFYNVTSGANVSITCGANTSINVSNGYSTFYYYANDSLGFNAFNSTTFLANWIRPKVNFTNKTVEGENNTIYFNVTADLITQANATLNHNGTNYAMDIYSVNSTHISFYKTVTAPFVTAPGLVYLNVSYYLNNVYYNMSRYNYTVENVPILNITAGMCEGTAMYNFNLADEENLSELSGDYEYNFYYGLSNSSLVRTYGKIEDSTNFSICINSTISPSWIIGSGEIFYTAHNGVYVDRRYYIFDNTNISAEQNITLYDLLTTSQTSFKLEVEDTSLTPYEGAYTKLYRWYPSLNEYKVVDIGKTDETGSTVIHVKTEDVDYRLGVHYSNGTLIYLANPIRMVCLASPCTYTLSISPTETDYTSFLNIDYTFTFNETSGIWLFTYIDTTGKTDTINLTVWKDTSTSNYIICSNITTGAVGTLTCNTSIYTGTLRGEVYRVASPPVILVQKLVNVFTSAFKGSELGLWLSMLIALPVIFLFAFVSPVAAIVGGVISLIPALYLGSINIGIVGGFAILGGIVAHFLKRIS